MIKRNLKTDIRGATVAEYGLIAAIIGSALAMGSLALGASISQAVDAKPAKVSGCAAGKAC